MCLKVVQQGGRKDNLHYTRALIIYLRLNVHYVAKYNRVWDFKGFCSILSTQVGYELCKNSSIVNISFYSPYILIY